MIRVKSQTSGKLFKEYNTPSKEEFTKLYGNDMVEIIAEYYNISPKMKMKTYFNEFPFKKINPKNISKTTI